MGEALITAGIVFLGTFGFLSLVEKIIHKLTHNPDKSYQWGVWTFALLAAAYAFATTFGR